MKQTSNNIAYAGLRIFIEVDGLEEEHLRVAFNDTDFCLKLRQKGYRNILNPRASVLHHESKTRRYENSPDKIRRFEDETNLIKQRWKKDCKNDPCYN